MASVSTEISSIKEQTLNSTNFFALLSVNLFMRSFIFSGLIYFSVVLGGWPGQWVLPVLILSFVVGLLAAYVYGKIEAQADAERGLYFYLKNRLGQFAAFVTTFVLFTAGNVLIGFLISFLPKYVFSEFFYLAGVGYENARFLDLAELVKTPQTISLLGIIMVLTAFVLTTFSKSIIPKFYILSTLLLLAIAAILLVQMGLPVHQGLDVAWNAFYGQISFSDVVIQARENGINQNIFGGVYTFASFSIVLWFFLQGYERINLNTSKKKRSSVWVNLLSTLITFLFLIGFFWLFFRNVGYSWMRAQAYLGMITQGDFPGGMTTFAGLLSPYPAYFILISFFLLITMVCTLGTTLIANGVFIQSWAEDNVLPQIFLLRNRTTGKFGISYLIISILFGIGIVLSAFSDMMVDVIGFILVMQLMQIPIFLAVLRFGNNTKLQKKPRFVSLAAGVIVIVLVFTLILFVITPVPTGFTPWLGLIVGGISFLLAIFYYYFLKNKLTQHN